MRGVSKKAFIAIEAVLYIACCPGAVPVRSREISGFIGVKLRYLEHIMQKLVHDGILRGVRGPKGGYVLARERRRIFLSEIFDSIRVLEESGEEEGEAHEECSALRKSVIHPLWDEALSGMRSVLQAISLEMLYDRVKGQGIVDDVRKKSDFVI